MAIPNYNDWLTGKTEMINDKRCDLLERKLAFTKLAHGVQLFLTLTKRLEITLIK